MTWSRLGHVMHWAGLADNEGKPDIAGTAPLELIGMEMTSEIRELAEITDIELSDHLRDWQIAGKTATLGAVGKAKLMLKACRIAAGTQLSTADRTAKVANNKL